MSRLTKISTKAPNDLDKKATKVATANIRSEINELQNLLYAEGNHSVLVIIQGMDASGKDGAIRNVFSGINPQGVTVSSFKVPTQEELSHDFLWRIHKNAPAKGIISIFNRSHYEAVLITRVHGWCSDTLATERFKAINDFEQLLIKHNSTTILKFYLHISQEEQQGRLKERMEDPTKAWKFNKNDLEESKLWNKYMQMYEDVFENCNDIPWNIVPSDQNWYKEHIIAETLRDTLKNLNMQYPKFSR